MDSTANTNLVFWAGKLLALKESAQPYAVDPDTLETLQYDPFKCPGTTFTPNPKYDPISEKLVCFGYEAKGLGTDDVVVYALDHKGQVYHNTWVNSPWRAFIHDCAITPNFIILILWPFEADVDHMKNGANFPANFIVVPSWASQVATGWSPGEYPVYHGEHALLLHTAGSWEESDGTKLYFESSRMAYNVFREFEVEPPQQAPNFKADYVRWEIDLLKVNIPAKERVKVGFQNLG